MIGTVAPTLHARRGRGFRVGVAIGAGVPILILLVASFVESGSPSGPVAPPAAVPADRAAEQFSAYEEALRPLIDEGASVVVYGMYPGVGDIAGGAFDDATLVDMASSWLATMERVRGEVAALEPPLFLAPTARIFGEAFAAYVATAEALLDAARATGSERERLIERVPPLGRQADQLFDEAEADLERQRARVGVSRG